MADQYLEGDPNSFQWGQGDWSGTGGGQKAQEYYAWKKYAQLFGHNPTQAELDQLASAYDSGDKNIANVSAGNAAVAAYYNNKINTPEAQALEQQKKYSQDAKQYYDQLNGQFQSTLGRQATADELDHFGKLLASGQADQYTIGEFLNQLPENVKKQDEDFRNSLRDTMSKEDARYFNEQVLPGIQSNYAKSGRSFDSSAFANAAAQAAQQQNTTREDYLTNLTASQYSGNKANAYNEYLNSVGRMNASSDYSRQRSDMLQDQLTKRINDMQDFAMQKQAYDQYLSRYGKRSNGSGVGGLIGGAIGLGVSAALPGPWSPALATAGYGIGSGMGSGAGSLWG